MNFKKFAAVVAATAVATSAMAFSAFATDMTKNDISAQIFVMGNGSWKWTSVEVSAVDGVLTADVDAAELIAGSRGSDAAIGDFGVQFANPIGKSGTDYVLADGDSYTVTYSLKAADGSVISEGTVADSDFAANGSYGQAAQIDILGNGSDWATLEAYGMMKFEATVDWTSAAEEDAAEAEEEEDAAEDAEEAEEEDAAEAEEDAAEAEEDAEEADEEDAEEAEEEDTAEDAAEAYDPGYPADLSAGQFTYDLVLADEDYENIKSVTFTLQASDADDFGGGVMFNGTACGWSQSESNFYSGPEGDKDLKAVAIGDNQYTLTVSVPDGIFGTYTDEDFYAQIVIQQWWGNPVSVLDVEVSSEAAAVEEEEAVIEEEAPVEEVAAEEEVVSTGDVEAATDSDKGSPDTGIADVAAIAGIAVVAAGAIVVAKKRK